MLLVQVVQLYRTLHAKFLTICKHRALNLVADLAEEEAVLLDNACAAQVARAKRHGNDGAVYIQAPPTCKPKPDGWTISVRLHTLWSRSSFHSVSKNHLISVVFCMSEKCVAAFFCHDETRRDHRSWLWVYEGVLFWNGRNACFKIQHTGRMS